MRKIGHQVNVEMMKSTYAANLKRIEQYPARKQEQLAKRNPLYFQGYMENSLRVARLGYLFDAPLDQIFGVLRSALQELPLVFEMGGMFHPRLMQEFLGASLLVQHQEMTSWLADLPLQAFQHPQLETSRVHYLIVEAEQAGARRDLERLSSAVSQMPLALTPENLIVDEAGEAEIFGPIVHLLQAVQDKDQNAFDKAWEEEGRAWNRRYGKPSEVANYDGVLDIETLGIGRIAQALGLKTPGTNPYAPLELLAP